MNKKGKVGKKGKKIEIEEIKEEAEEVEEEEEIVDIDPRFAIEGIDIVKLSDQTQKELGCVIGEDLTTDDPWVWIKKEKIVDNLEFREETSEFKSIQNNINNYPEGDILMGYIQPSNNNKQIFYVCSLIKGKDTVLTILEEEKIALQEKITKSIVKTSGKWTSYGSEIEVDDNILKNMRPLIGIEIEARFPLYSENKKFSFRMAQDAIDGYIEILPGRFPYINIYRKRVDAYIQATPPITENFAQTNPTYPTNKWTQYNYTCTKPVLSPENIKSLTNFVNSQIEQLNDKIDVNAYINFYMNDYANIGTEVEVEYIKIKRNRIDFRDVVSCKSMLVSCVSINPMISGIIAASYSKAPANKIFTSPPTYDVVSDTIFLPHYTLVWCNTDSLNPKLYLHSYREVNVVKYCPFNVNLLVGGCTNGQVVMWDLTGKLEKVETREILNPLEQKHRHILKTLMVWMKNVEDRKVVYPTVVSDLDFSHNDSVTSIEWILPQYEITRNGKLMKKEDGSTSMQFMTCGLDGKVLIWDLLKEPYGTSVPKAKKSQLVGTRPAALTSDISPYKHLNNVWIPQYKLIVENEQRIRYPLTGLVIDNLNFFYKPTDTKNLENYYVRTYFELTDSIRENYEFPTNFTVVTKLGDFIQCSFEGHDFDQGKKVNFESCKIVEFYKVHDGPITLCLPHNRDPHLILTVGGRVFAVWDTNKPILPHVWRKSDVKCVSGKWSAYIPGSVVITKINGLSDTWELLNKMKNPGRVMRTPGNQIMDVYGDISLRHVRKLSYICTDVTGTIRVFNLPKINIINHKQVVYGQILRKRTETRRKKLREWLTYWKERYGVTVIQEQTTGEKTSEPVVEPEPEAPSSKKKEISEKSASDKWKEKQEEMMYEILLEKKKLNLADIEKNKVPLQKLIEEQAEKVKKIETVLKNKDKIYNNEKKFIFKETPIIKRKKYEINFPEEVVQELKNQYRSQYEIAEEESLWIINEKPFKYVFNWNDLKNKGKDIRMFINRHTGKVDTHKELYEQSKSKLKVSSIDIKEDDY